MPSSGPKADAPPADEAAARIAAAESAVARLGDVFRDGALSQIQTIETLCAEAKTADEARRAAILEKIGDIAHDLKGQGSSFDYVLVTRIGAMLCDYVRGDVGADEDKLAHAERCHMALGGVLRHGLTGDGGELGGEILRALDARV